MTLRRIVEKRSLNVRPVKIKTLSWLFYIGETKNKDRYLMIYDMIKYRIYLGTFINKSNLLETIDRVIRTKARQSFYFDTGVIMVNSR